MRHYFKGIADQIVRAVQTQLLLVGHQVLVYSPLKFGLSSCSTAPDYFISSRDRNKTVVLAKQQNQLS